jgi:hypothetical protein
MNAPAPQTREEADDRVKKMTAPHADKGLGQGRKKFRVERVMVRLNFWNRLKYLLTGGAITMALARAPQRVSGVELIELRIVSWWQLRKLQQERQNEAERRAGGTNAPKVDTRAGDEVVAALKGALKP